MPVKISVVVAVYNPGRHIEPLLDSLQAQTLPREEFEAVFVDDGSTDGTPERLERYAAKLGNVQVIRIEPSGGPSRPRNVGIDAARGEYVQIVDNDDHLGPEALQRLYDYATANGSDVVISREVRNQRAAPGPLFEHNRPDAKLGVDPILSLLTPHKMFRRQFLLDNGIRFIEGRRRLEDHPFVVEAFVKASVISVLADYPCYFWTIRDDHSNAGMKPVDWPSWYDNMSDALAVVEKHVVDPDLRHRLLAHWYRTKVVGKLGPGFANRSEAEARVQFAAAQDVTARFFGPEVQQHMRGVLRTRSHLLVGGHFDAARTFAATDRRMTVAHRVHGVRQQGDAIELDVSAWFVYADGTPLRCDERNGRLIYRSPTELPALPPDALDFTDALDSARIRVIVRRQGTWVSYTAPGDSQLLPPDGDGARRIGSRSVVRIDPEHVVSGGPLTRGAWDLDVQLGACGWTAIASMRMKQPEQEPPILADPLLTRRITVPFVRKNGTVALDVDEAKLAVVESVAGAPTLDRGGDDLVLRVPLPGLRGRPGRTRKGTVQLDPADGGEPVTLSATVKVGPKGQARLVTKLPGNGTLTRGTWLLSVRIARRRTALAGVLHVGRMRTTLRSESAGSVR